MSQSAQVGQTVTFNCVAGAYPSPSYSWSTSNANTFVTSNIMISTTYSSFGNYTCTASSNGVVVISYTAVLTGNCVLFVKFVNICNIGQFLYLAVFAHLYMYTLQ